MAAHIGIDSRTIHTLRVSVPDDILSALGTDDEVEVILCSRFGDTSAKKLTFRDLHRLLEDRSFR